MTGNKQTYQDERAAKLAKAFQDATGLKTQVAFSSVDGKTALIISPKGSDAQATRIIDDVLVKLRNELGIESKHISFGEGQGKIHALFEEPKANSNQIVIFMPDKNIFLPNDNLLDDTLIKGLKDKSHEIKIDIGKTLGLISAAPVLTNFIAAENAQQTLPHGKSQIKIV